MAFCIIWDSRLEINLSWSLQSELPGTCDHLFVNKGLDWVVTDFPTHAPMYYLSSAITDFLSVAVLWVHIRSVGSTQKKAPASQTRDLQGQCNPTNYLCLFPFNKPQQITTTDSDLFTSIQPLTYPIELTSLYSTVIQLYKPEIWTLFSILWFSFTLVSLLFTFYGVQRGTVALQMARLDEKSITLAYFKDVKMTMFRCNVEIATRISMKRADFRSTLW